MRHKTKYFLILFIVFIPFYLFRLKQKLKVPFQEGDRVKISSNLSQEPTIKGQNQYFKIKGISVKTSKKHEYHYGDNLQIIGLIEKKEAAGFFNQFQLINPQIQKTKPSKSPVKLLFQFRRRLEEIINQALPEPHASLLAVILLGIQRSMSFDFYQSLKITGTLHIIVASGMNIALVAGHLKEVLSYFLKREQTLTVSLIIILIYCIMAGASPPIVRASIMAGALYLSEFIGREAEGLWILILTAFVMLIFNPLLLFDVGFQLSFMATAGLILISKPIEKKLTKIPFVNKINEELAETLSAIIFTFPILTITFGHFNPLSIIPNILVIPLVPYLFYLGLLMIVFGLILMPLAYFFGWLAWLPLAYMVKTIDFFGRFKIFDLELQNLSWIFGLGFYLILLCLITKKKNVQNH